MRKVFVLLVISFFLFFSCGKKNKPPRHILQQEKMEDVLWDLMRADQFLFTYVLPKDSSKNKQQESQKIYSQIFQLHTINEGQFKESFAWYKEHPDLLKVIMDSITQRSSAQQVPVQPPEQPAAVPTTITTDDSTTNKASQPAPVQDSFPRKPVKKAITAD